MRHALLRLDDVEVGDWIDTYFGSRSHGSVVAIDRDRKLLNYQDGTVTAFTAYWPDVEVIRPSRDVPPPDLAAGHPRPAPHPTL